MKLTRAEKIYKTVCYSFAILIALLSLYPLLYTVFLSLISEREWLERGGLLLFMPSNPSLAAYIKILGSSSYVLQALGISVSRAVIGTLLGLFFNICTGYAMSRKDLPGRKTIMILIMITILFNGGLIPGFITNKQVGLYNNFWVMVIPAIMSGWNILLFKQFFEGIPKELEEAAQIDGAGEFKLMLRIIMPMSKSVIAAIGLFTVVGHWNSWFDARIFIDDQHSYLWPLQLFTQITFENMAQINSNPAGSLFNVPMEGVANISQRMALTVVTILPVLIIYPFFQKYFQKGVYTGAVKG